jgi:hypothetical protein
MGRLEPLALSGLTSSSAVPVTPLLAKYFLPEKQQSPYTEP